MGSPTDESIKVGQEAVVEPLPDKNVDDRPCDVDPREERAFVSAAM